MKMQDGGKTKEELLRELTSLRECLSELEKINSSRNASRQMVMETNTRLQELAQKSKGKETELTDELKTLQSKLVRQERLAAMGKLGSIVGHEIRNPLGVIKNSATFLGMRLTKNVDEKVKRHLKILEAEVDKVDKIVTDILDFARLKKLELTPGNIHDLIEAVIREVKTPSNVKVSHEPSDELPSVRMDVDQVERVFLNLIRNAFDAMESGGLLTIAAKPVQHNGSSYVAISFQDTGSGISEENLPKVFEALFTTKTKGTGLGLSACQNIVEAHEGFINIESKEGQGATSIVKLPINGPKEK